MISARFIVSFDIITVCLRKTVRSWSLTFSLSTNFHLDGSTFSLCSRLIIVIFFFNEQHRFLQILIRFFSIKMNCIYDIY